MQFYKQLFTELTPEVQASICGGVDTANAHKNSKTKTLVGKGRARIRYELGEKLPDKNISSEYGECRPYFDNFTGQFTYSCVLRDVGIFGDKMFPDL